MRAILVFNPNATTTDEHVRDVIASALASELALEVLPTKQRGHATHLVAGAVHDGIDAVFARDDGGFTVVDWKTGAKPAGPTLRHRSLQLAAYALGYARLRGLDPEDVDAAFFYAATGETYRPGVASQRDLEELLGSVGG